MSQAESQNRLDIVWASDENYVFLAGVSMTSVLENNKDIEDIRIWYLTDGISKESQELLKQCAEKYERQISFLDVNSLLNNVIDLGARSWGEQKSYSAYSRLFLEVLLRDKGVSRALYCDCDLILNGSLKPILDCNMGGKAIGLVMDYNRVEIRDILGLNRADSYYNTGFMWMDLKLWREKQCTERILHHMETVCSSYPYVDQDLINCVLHDEIFTLPMKYNVNPRVVKYTYKQLCTAYGLNSQNYYSEQEYDKAHAGDIVCYHCSDPAAGKPWEIGNRHIYSDIWNHYYKKSLWDGTYQMQTYRPNRYSVAQRILERVIPKSVYAFVLGMAAKWIMKKLKKRYAKYRVSE